MENLPTENEIQKQYKKVKSLFRAYAFIIKFRDGKRVY